MTQKQIKTVNLDISICATPKVCLCLASRIKKKGLAPPLWAMFVFDVLVITQD